MGGLNLSALSEGAFLKLIRRELRSGPRTVVDIGDDAAAVKHPWNKDRLLLLKTDCVVEGVHFLPEHPAGKVGWKALCRAISDIAAMGGEPCEALVTIASPRSRTVRYWRDFYRGMERAARRYGVHVVGGETTRSPGPVFVNVAMTGTVSRRRCLTRTGARSGHGIFVTGKLGGSIRGKHLTFEPRLREAQWLAEKFPVSAMMDLSDGLAADLPRMAEASNCGFDVDMAAIPRSRGCTVEQALGDGEDYELLFAMPLKEEERLLREWKKAFPKLPLTRIGRFIRDGVREFALRGFDHFGIEPGRVNGE